MERSPGSGGLSSLELFDESIGAHDIRDAKIPAWYVGGAISSKRSDPYALDVVNGARVIGEVRVDLHPGGGGGGRGIIHFPVIAERQAVLEGVVPEESGR